MYHLLIRAKEEGPLVFFFYTNLLAQRFSLLLLAFKFLMMQFIVMTIILQAVTKEICRFYKTYNITSCRCSSRKSSCIISNKQEFATLSKSTKANYSTPHTQEVNTNNSGSSLTCQTEHHASIPYLSVCQPEGFSPFQVLKKRNLLK